MVLKNKAAFRLSRRPLADTQFRRKSSNHTRHLNGGDSAKSREALAKDMYRRLFDWVVDKVCVLFPRETG